MNKLEGLKVSLIDENYIEDLGFSGTNVIATIGVKGGAICAPILSLVINTPTSVTLKAPDFSIEWREIEIGSDYISVVRNGLQTKYKIVSSYSQNIS